jgi:hypothetical protein
MSAPEETGNDAGTMAELSISYNGRQYHYGMFRYDQLADAIAYARGHPGDAGAEPAAAAIDIPDASERRLMSSLAITFRNGVYHLGAYRYDRLADAVAYARLLRMQGPA